MRSVYTKSLRLLWLAYNLALLLVVIALTTETGSIALKGYTSRLITTLQDAMPLVELQDSSITIRFIN